MALTIKWSERAKVNYDNVLAYLHDNWSNKEVEKFINRTDSILAIISHQPYMFKASSHKRIRKAVINK
jgi:plasmid stabilization system protein ParE